LRTPGYIAGNSRSFEDTIASLSVGVSDAYLQFRLRAGGGRRVRDWRAETA
jgi:hypothetical protein